MEESPTPRLGCKHYERKCKFVAPCCNKTYWCRLCHDETECGASVVMRTPKLAHKIDRFKVKRIVCQVCDTEQDVKAKCEKCDVSFAKYVCLKCNLFDEDDSKGQYHCDKCGFCRVGGASNFFHCDTCGTCFRSKIGHVCVERATHSDCPVCMEFMFDSRDPSVAMRCGHVIHIKCQEQLLKKGIYKCPLCSKSMVSRKQMMPYFRAIDEAIASTEMPEEYRNKKVRVHCNDCNQSSETLFHFHGLKCMAYIEVDDGEDDSEDDTPKNSTAEVDEVDEVDESDDDTPKNSTAEVDVTEEDGVSSKNSTTEDADASNEKEYGDYRRLNTKRRSKSPVRKMKKVLCGSYNTRRD